MCLRGRWGLNARARAPRPFWRPDGNSMGQLMTTELNVARCWENKTKKMAVPELVSTHRGRVDLNLCSKVLSVVVVVLSRRFSRRTNVRIIKSILYRRLRRTKISKNPFETILLFHLIIWGARVWNGPLNWIFSPSDSVDRGHRSSGDGIDERLFRCKCDIKPCGFIGFRWTPTSPLILRKSITWKLTWSLTMDLSIFDSCWRM